MLDFTSGSADTVERSRDARRNTCCGRRSFGASKTLSHQMNSRKRGRVAEDNTRQFVQSVSLNANVSAEHFVKTESRVCLYSLP